MSRAAKLARLVCAPGLDRLARLSWRGLVILNYHRIGVPSEFDDPDLFSATVDDLDMHVELISRRFEIVTAGKQPLDSTGRYVAFTVDDGYRDQMLAAEVFSSHGIPASFYVSTGFVDEPHHAWWDEIAWLTRGLAVDLPPSKWFPQGLRTSGQTEDDVRRAVTLAYKERAGSSGTEFLDWLSSVAGRPRIPAADVADRWMTWDDVRDLRHRGMEIGGHTVTHPVLSTLDADGQRWEIAESMRRLREEVGPDVDTFAYPVGAESSFDSTTRALMSEMGIKRAYSFCGGYNRPRKTDHLNVRRIGVFGEDPDVVLATATLPSVFGSPRRYT